MHRLPGSSLAVQIFGGAGYMRGIKVKRIYREVRVNAKRICRASLTLPWRGRVDREAIGVG